MKIAIVTNFLYPEGLGGTELYSYQLANALIERGNEVYWFVPNFNNIKTITEERGNGIKIVKFAAFDETPAAGGTFITGSFIKEIKERNISIAHFNEFGGYEGISTELLAETKQAGIATVVTLHLASYICQTGTLHYAGIQPCNGEMIPGRCASCELFSNKTFSQSANLMLARIFHNLVKINPVRSIPKIERFIDGINLKAAFISMLKEHADVVVSLTKWFRDVLVINGIPVHKIIHIPQSSPQINMLNIKQGERKGYVFIGRVDKPKGIGLILDIASRLKKHFPGTIIDIYGPSYGPYVPENRIRNSAYANLEKFDNVHYKGVLDPGEVLPVMNKYKAVLLPSLVAEMAPLIIMEANTLKVPVIASDVPGSAELINEYDCGLIFQYGSADDLYNKIKEIEDNIHQFAFKQPDKNSFYNAAQKYEEIYTACLSHE